MGLPFVFSLQGYCENCRRFVPQVESEEYIDDGKERIQHTVVCENRALCAEIADRLIEQVTECQNMIS